MPKPMSLPIRPPKWTSHRRLLERHLADLPTCSHPAHLKQIHAQLIRSYLYTDPFLAPKLISSYSLSHLLSLAVNVFDQIPHPNALLYNTLIRALTHNAQHRGAFSAFLRMQEDGVFPDNFTYPFLLKACTGQFAMQKVEMVHAHVVKLGFLDDIFVPNSLIDSYSKAGNAGIAAARRVFDEMPCKDVVTWNSMVAGLVRAGELGGARNLFDEMPERDTVSWNTMLDGHSKAGEMDKAFELFQMMPQRNVVSWSTMVWGYCKLDDMEMARMLFDRMPVKNLVPWTIMIAGYAEKGFAKEASCLLDQMEEAGLEPDGATVISVLAACAESGLFGLGMRMHSYIEKSKLKFTTEVCNALVDMYAKCGNLDKAWRVFEEMRQKDRVSWNSMVQGLANHGHGERALKLFVKMISEGIKPDAVTFVGVLCACTHVGLIDEARRYFASMEKDYGIIPEIEHYGCMIDILGRGGHLDEAFDLARTMPLEPNAIIWGSLLSACRVHNNVSLAEEAVDQLIRLQPSDAGNYAILSNIYAAAGRWDGVAKTRIQMKNIQKPVGSSWIELDDSVHEFTVGDRSHPQSARIFKMINRLRRHLKQDGYVPKGLLVD